MNESGARAQAAYTDVDGTVVAYNTIFEFLRFDANLRNSGTEATTFLAGLRASAQSGVPRSVTNAQYFSWWRGRTVAEIAELGEHWADSQEQASESWRFLEPVTSLLDEHTRLGRQIVAVTASFPPALVRVQRRWPHMVVVPTTALSTKDGVYTGEIAEAMVGDAKARAVVVHAERCGIDLTASYAYGDHHSDLPFMSLVGESLLVGPSGPVTL